jgi:hypothetical protein
VRFRSSGVTQVVFLSASVEANFVLFFATAAEAQQYRPGLALTSGAGAAIQQANAPQAQLAHAFGVGWLPSIDTSRASAPLPAAQQCLRDLRTGGGVSPQSPLDRLYAFGGCSAFALADAGLRHTAGAAGSSLVTRGIGGLGRSFASASVLAERTDFTAGRRTAPSAGRVFAWNPSCSCFDYTGSSFAIG